MPARVTCSVAIGVKVATTVRGTSIVSVHDPVFVQSPLQPLKEEQSYLVLKEPDKVE